MSKRKNIAINKFACKEKTTFNDHKSSVSTHGHDNQTDNRIYMKQTTLQKKKKLCIAFSIYINYKAKNIRSVKLQQEKNSHYFRKSHTKSNALLEENHTQKQNIAK